MTRLAILVVLVGLVACRGSSTPRPIARGVDPDTVRTLAVLTTGKPAEQVVGAPSPWLTKLGASASDLPAYIDMLLARPEFAEVIAPEILVMYAFREVGGAPAILPRPLQATKEGERTILHLGKSCAASDAVEVSPWWAPETRVLICRDSYRPAVVKHERNGETTYCGAILASPECGCGPSLIRCASDVDHLKRIAKAAVRELDMTVAHVARENLPLATTYTMNATVRDRDAEYLYLLHDDPEATPEALATRLAAAASWSEPALHKRDEHFAGQHAGLLTTPTLLYTVLDGRQRQREYYAMTWCSTANSQGATAHDLFAIKGVDLQGKHDGWQMLAARPVCTNCHARLDYSMQFFQAYGDIRSPGPYALAKTAPTSKVKFYSRDIDDLRGEELATPAAYARLVTTQPEFAACMSRRVADYVLGDDATPADLSRVQAAYERAPTLRNLMRTALLIYAERRGQANPVARPDDQRSLKADRAGSKAAVRAFVDRNCVDCHDEPQASQPDFTGELSAGLLFKMASAVEYGTMPKGTDLSVLEREGFARSALQVALPDDRVHAAQSYVLDRETALGVHGLETGFAIVEARAGAKPGVLQPITSLNTLESKTELQHRRYTPSFAATLGLRAIEACRTATASTDRAAFDACIERATDPTAQVKSVYPSRR